MISDEELLESAWGIIANAGWDDLSKSPGWQDAAVRWRNKYFREHGTVPTEVQANHAKTVALLGKRVRVTLNQGGYPDKDSPAVISEGTLVGFGDEGTVEIMEDDCFIHYCWPMLDVKEVIVDDPYQNLPADQVFLPDGRSVEEFMTSQEINNESD